MKKAKSYMDADWWRGIARDWKKRGMKNCGPKELDALFREIKTHIDNDNNEGAIVVDEIEPIVQDFIREYYGDVELGHILVFLWVWYEQWREKHGDWDGVNLPAFWAIAKMPNTKRRIMGEIVLLHGDAEAATAAAKLRAAGGFGFKFTDDRDECSDDTRYLMVWRDEPDQVDEKTAMERFADTVEEIVGEPLASYAIVALDHVPKDFGDYGKPQA